MNTPVEKIWGGIADFVKNYVASYGSELNKPKNKQKVIGIASIPGGTRMSDGSIQFSPEVKNQMAERIVSPQERTMLNILVGNLLSQTGYTPAAKKDILNTYIGTYGTKNASSKSNNSAGQAGGGDVFINRNTMIPGTTFPISTLRHEIIHSMDDALYPPNQAEGLINSSGFAQALSDFMNKQYRNIYYGPIQNSGLYNPNDVRSLNTEVLAYHGMKGNSVMNQDNPNIAQRYANVYTKNTPTLNFSPVFPSEETVAFINSLGGGPRPSTPSLVSQY